MTDKEVAKLISTIELKSMYYGADEMWGKALQLIRELQAENVALKEQKDRAEVAEKALDLCETAYILSLNHRATEGISGQAIASDLGVHKFFIKQAEKELAKEKKDDSPRT